MPKKSRTASSSSKSGHGKEPHGSTKSAKALKNKSKAPTRKAKATVKQPPRARTKVRSSAPMRSPSTSLRKVEPTVIRK
jgi:hypothetical protein